MIEKFLQTWKTLAGREKRLVGAALGIVVLAVVYLLMFEPAWTGRRQLQGELPTLRSQLAQMSALANEARRLGAVPKGAESPQAMRAALERIAALQSLSADVREIVGKALAG